MPTMANAGHADRQTGKDGDGSSPANAPPSVAPMNSDGEKMPPDEPEPRLNDVASSLQAYSSNRNHAPLSWLVSVAWIVA